MKYLLLIPNSIPFLSFQEQLTYIQTLITYEKCTKIAQNQKPVTDFVLLYNIFANNLYDHTPFKIFITYSRFLTPPYFMFNPASSKLNLPSSNGIRFHMPHMYLHFALEKRVKSKLALVHL